jgi:hypothetical protein
MNEMSHQIRIGKKWINITTKREIKVAKKLMRRNGIKLVRVYCERKPSDYYLHSERGFCPRGGLIHFILGD